MLRSCCLQTRVEERGEVIKKKMATPDYAGKTPVRIKEQVGLCACQPLQRVLTVAMQYSFSCPGLPTPHIHAGQHLSKSVDSKASQIQPTRLHILHEHSGSPQGAVWTLPDSAVRSLQVHMPLSSICCMQLQDMEALGKAQKELRAVQQQITDMQRLLKS